MKKVIVFVLFCIGFSTASYSQAGKESSAKSGNFFSRLFHRADKPRAQMHHFDSPKKDPNMKHNGNDAYHKNKKSEYKVDGDGFGLPSNGNKKRGKSTGVK
jgi:hypothetical protein